MKADVTIDARMIRHSGIGTYVRGLAAGLETAGNQGLNLSLLDETKFVSPIYSVREQLEYPFKLSGCKLWHAPHYNIPYFKGGTRLVVTVHDLIHWIFRKQFFTPAKAFYAGTFMRRTVKTADRIIAVSQKTKDDLVKEFAADPAKITVIHEGVSPRFHPSHDTAAIEAVRKRYNLPQKFFLYLGLIKPHKNVQWLVRTFRRLKKEGKIEAGLVLAGKKDKHYPAEFRELEEIGSASDISYVPYVEEEDLVRFYQAAHALVHPSIYEGFGLTLLEAMGSGTPVVACRAASIPEVAGDAACLVIPGDDGAFSQALERMDSDNVFRAGLVQKGLTRSKQFQWSETARKTVNVYKQVLA